MWNSKCSKRYKTQRSIFDNTRPYAKKKSFYDKPDFDKTKETKDNIYFNSYQNVRKFGTLHLLAKWKGSVYRLIWHDIIIFLVCYFALTLIYKAVLCNENFVESIHKQRFELMCIYAKRYSEAIPIALLTGFYVTSVVSRWWDQFMALPYPDGLALKLVAFVPGHTPFLKDLRRTVMRYVNLSSILAYTKITSALAEECPTYDTFVEKKLLLPHEVERIKKVDEKTPHESSWAPLLWAMKLLTRAKDEGKIKIADPVFANLQSSFTEIEDCNRKLLSYGWVNFPLAYTQVAHLAVFTYFGACLFSRQFLIPPEDAVDKESFPDVTIFPYGKTPFDNHTPGYYIPVFTIIEMVCYMGWIKVAESLLNPFGDDDEDFNIKYLIIRNLQVSYLIVDEADEDLEMAEDPYLDEGLLMFWKRKLVKS